MNDLFIKLTGNCLTTYCIKNEPHCLLCVSVQFSGQGLAAVGSDADETVGRQLAAF